MNEQLTEQTEDQRLNVNVSDEMLEDVGNTTKGLPNPAPTFNYRMC
jgi:hypothetical protein